MQRLPPSTRLYFRRYLRCDSVFPAKTFRSTAVHVGDLVNHDSILHSTYLQCLSQEKRLSLGEPTIESLRCHIRSIKQLADNSEVRGCKAKDRDDLDLEVCSLLKILRTRRHRYGERT